MSKKIVNRFDCLLDDDNEDEIAIPNKPKDLFPTLTEKFVNIHDKQPKKAKWVAPKPEPVVEQPKVESAPAAKKDKKKKPSPKHNNTTPKHNKPEVVEDSTKKNKKEDNRLKMLAQMNGGELPVAIAPTPVIQPQPLLPPPPPPQIIPSSWVTITIDKKNRSKPVMKNYNIAPPAVDKNYIAATQINALCNNYRKHRQEYIDTFGVDAYNEKYISPWHDYHYFDRESPYTPSVYEKYVPEYLPYVISAHDGVVDDLIFCSDNDNTIIANSAAVAAVAVTTTDTITLKTATSTLIDDDIDILGTTLKYSNVNKYMYV